MPWKVPVYQRGEQIVRRRNGVKIAIEVKIDFGAGLDLREPAASRPAFPAENGTKRRLARGNDDFLADMRKALREADGSDRLSVTGWGGCRGRDDNKFAALVEGGIGEQFEPDFATVWAYLLEIFLRNFEFAGYRLNRKKSICLENCGAMSAKKN